MIWIMNCTTYHTKNYIWTLQIYIEIYKKKLPEDCPLPIFLTNYNLYKISFIYKAYKKNVMYFYVQLLGTLC